MAPTFCGTLSGIVNMARIFKTRYFARLMRKTELTNNALLEAVNEMTNGLIDADLGGGVVKKRIGITGRGKRGGARTLIATNKGDRWFFIFGFEKSARANIDGSELDVLRDLAGDLLGNADTQLDVLVEDGALEELLHE